MALGPQDISALVLSVKRIHPTFFNETLEPLTHPSPKNNFPQNAAGQQAM